MVLKEFLMKRILLTAVLLLANCSLVSAQSADLKQAPDKASNTEQELKQITREKVDALVRGDKAYLDLLLVDTFIETSAEGRTYNKAQIMESVKGLPAGVKVSIEIEDAQVFDHGDTALMVYRRVERVDANGQKIESQNRVTDTFIRRDGRWRTISSQATRIPAERIATKVDPRIYDSYAGQYEITPALIVTITREGDKLMMQATGQSKYELLPENETTFFVKGQRNQMIFSKDEKGQVTHLIARQSDGQELRIKKIK
jgi:ketosteroid isomerase-like protein